MAIPSRVIALGDGVATVEAFGQIRTTSLMMIEEEIALGDYLVLGAGGQFAAEKMDPATAQEALAYLAEVLESGQA